MRDGLFWLIPLAAVLAGPAIVIFGMWTRSRTRELEIRERIAMIEKGLVPPPERDPAGFEQAMRLTRDRPWRAGAAARHRRAGITLIGVGLGLMLMIGFAGDEPRNAVGVGGFIAVLGLAFLINSLFESGEDKRAAPPPPNSPPV
jgi:hypothetical protein